MYGTVNCYSEKGILNSGGNKDSTLIKMMDDKCILGMADGVNSMKKAKTGGEKMLDSISRVLEKLTEDDIIKNSREIRNHILSAIDQTIRGFPAETGDEIREYASTLLMIVVFPDGLCYWFNIGDGAIFDIKKDSSYIISHPKNGLKRNSTYTTVNRPLSRYMFDGKFRIQNNRERICLMTDGILWKIYDQRELLKTGEEFLRSDFSSFADSVKKYELKDDHSIIIFEYHTREDGGTTCRERRNLQE